MSEDGSQGRFVSPELIAEYGDKPTQTYLYLTRRSNQNGKQAEHNIASEARRTESVVESGHGGVAQTVREGRGADKRGDTGSVSELSSPTSEIANYDWYNNDVEYGQPLQLIESSEQSDLPEGMGAASAEFTGEMTPAEKWVSEAQGKGVSFR